VRKSADGVRSKPTGVAKRQARATTRRTTKKLALPPADAIAGSQVDWRAETLAEVRRLIQEADPAVIEERKWKKPKNPSGVPAWSQGGILCTGETYQQVVKLTFARGARLQDPQKLFNASLEGGTRRAIDIRKGATLDAEAFKDLIRAAIAENLRAGAPPAKSPAKTATRATKSGAGTSSAARADPPARRGTTTKVVLLSGGNPQIAKADGDAPVQAYIAAMPGWKSDLGRRLDALIVRNVPRVRKAVRWNSPFYGIDGQGWFLSFHVLTRYVKVTFFNGMSLRPIPPGGTERSKESRWIDLYEDDALDEALLAKWVKQAAALPGWTP